MAVASPMAIAPPQQPPCTEEQPSGPSRSPTLLAVKVEAATESVELAEPPLKRLTAPPYCPAELPENAHRSMV